MSGAGAVRVERGVEFVRRGERAIQGDFYRPAGAGAHPVVVALHGGGWQLGGPERYAEWGPWLAARGVALFAATYRLWAPGVKASWPDCFQDARAAVQFVRGHAARFGIDPARIGTIGDSAGAHLAAMVALAGDRPEFAAAGETSTKVKAVVGVYGVYDLAAQWEHDRVPRASDPITEKLMGAALPDNRRLFFDASPISYATRDNNQSAFLLAWGTADDIVDHRTQSEAFLRALKQSGAFARPAVLTDAPHFWMDDPIDEPTSYSGFLAPRLLRFLQARL